MRLLLSKNKSFLIKDLTKDYHTQFGFIKKEDLKKSKVKTNKGIEFSIIKPQFIDLYKKIKRAPQIIPRKDIGLIIAETGIGKTSKVLDSGSGSGALAIMLANIVKTVTTYEIREDHLNVVKHNIKFLNLKNIKPHLKNIYEGITEKNLDLIVLDLPEPWLAVKHTIKALKPGAFIVNYSPTVPQIMDFMTEVNKYKELSHHLTTEIIQRDWEFEDRKVRPKSQMMGHSGFLTIIRKI
jgi:tRNA (adenine57-N1/adenine58-N1)-methyltransferase catalytic subunit